MTKEELLQWVESQGFAIRDLPRAEWPVVIERSGDDFHDDDAFLVVPVRVKDDAGRWVMAGDEIVSEEQRIPLGTRRNVLEWLRTHGVETDLTPERGLRVVATDPPFILAERVVRDGTRRLIDVMGDVFTTEREYRLQFMPERVGAAV